MRQLFTGFFTTNQDNVGDTLLSWICRRDERKKKCIARAITNVPELGVIMTNLVFIKNGC